jgi:hypothetical protein
MWHKFQRTQEANDTSAVNLDAKAICAGSVRDWRSHEVTLRMAVVDTTTRPFHYYCVPCAKDRGYTVTSATNRRPAHPNTSGFDATRERQ